jgi:uncharacterized protein YkwD
MKKKLLFGVVNTLLLLSIVAGVFVAQSSMASAKSSHHKHKHHIVSKKHKHHKHHTVSTNSSSTNSSSTNSSLAQQLFALINSDRAAQGGLPPYQWNATLAQGALAHSELMGQTSCGLSHQCPGEPDPSQRITNEGISWTYSGENAGYTSPDPDDWTAIQVNIEQAMLDEQPPDDGHRLNLLSTQFTQVGVGIYIDSQGIIWVTEDFVG